MSEGGTNYKKALNIWHEGSKLNEDDYHASTGFLSNSFIGNFQKCEYGSIIDGGIKKESEFSQTYAIGHLVEAFIFEGEEGFNKMVERYKQNAYSKAKGKEDKLLKWVTDYYELADVVLKHDYYKNLFRSESSIYHQVITFDLLGFKWRGEIDYLNLNKLTEIDLKTTKSNFVDRAYNPETRTKDLTFIDEWNYHRQRALYQEGIKQTYDKVVTPRILGISKTIKMAKMFKFDDQDRLDYEIKELEPVVDRFKSVLAGDEPQKCGICQHCIDAHDPTLETLTSTYCAKVY